MREGVGGGRGIVHGREHEHGEVAVDAEGMWEYVESGHSRHTHVTQHDLEMLLAQPRKRRRAGLGHDGLVAATT